MTNIKKNKVLLVEDEEMLAKMYQTKFQNEGYDIILAANGEAGLKIALENKPDIILLDIIMPKLDGFSVLKSLKDNSQTKNIPVILLSNLGQEEDIKKGKSMGAAGYLVKANLTPAEVVEKAKEYLK